MNDAHMEKLKHMKCKLMDMLCDLDDSLEEESKSGSVSMITIKAVSKILASIHYIEEMQDIHETKEEDAEIAVGIAAVKAAGVAANKEAITDSSGSDVIKKIVISGK